MMAANGEPAQEGEGADVDDESTSFFSLELPLTGGGHRSLATDDHHEEKYGNDKGIDGPELVAAAAEATASEALGTPAGPAARLCALVRRLRWPKKAAAAVTARAQAAQPSPAAACRTSAEAALKYLSKVPILACRSGVVADDDTSPPPHLLPLQQAASVLSRRNSRSGESGLTTQACQRRLGVVAIAAGRSSVSEAGLPQAAPPRRDDSLLQAQDGVASAIAYCKLSFSPSRGLASPMVSSRG